MWQLFHPAFLATSEPPVSSDLEDSTRREGVSVSLVVRFVVGTRYQLGTRFRLLQFHPMLKEDSAVGSPRVTSNAPSRVIQQR